MIRPISIAALSAHDRNMGRNNSTLNGVVGAREDLQAVEAGIRAILRESGNQAAIELTGFLADIARMGQAILFYGL